MPRISALVLVAILSGVVGCQTMGNRGVHTVPTSRDYQQLEEVSLADAEAALAEAFNVGAGAFAPFEFAAAQDYLGLARAQRAEGDKAGAWDYAALAKEAAEAAARKGAGIPAPAKAMPDDKAGVKTEFERLKTRFMEVDKEKAAVVAPALLAEAAASLSLAEHEILQGSSPKKAAAALSTIETDLNAMAAHDADEDGIGDLTDGAPWLAEDKDGFQDEDGVPDPDNDQDGILDANDSAPNEPETKNRWRDCDGAPDEYPALDRILFGAGSATMSADDRGYLRGLTLPLAENPGLKLHIAGYADDSNSESGNLELSRRRAQTVQEFLIQRGVKPEQLVVTFHGPAEAGSAGRSQRVDLRFE